MVSSVQQCYQCQAVVLVSLGWYEQRLRNYRMGICRETSESRSHSHEDSLEHYLIRAICKDSDTPEFEKNCTLESIKDQNLLNIMYLFWW